METKITVKMDHFILIKRDPRHPILKNALGLGRELRLIKSGVGVQILQKDKAEDNPGRDDRKDRK